MGKRIKELDYLRALSERVIKDLYSQRELIGSLRACIDHKDQMIYELKTKLEENGLGANNG